MGFKEWLEILEEMFGSFSYEVPKDKEKQLYDFYMLSYLRSLSSYDIDRATNREKTGGYDVKAFSVVREPGEMDNEDKIDYMLKEVAEQLLPALKTNLLAATFYSLCIEMRHVFDNDLPGDLVKMVEKNLGAEDAKGFREYAKRMAMYQSHISAPLMRIPEPHHSDLAPRSSQEYGPEPYYAALKSGLSQSHFVKVMEFLYNNAKWRTSYGGPAWAKICKGWEKLNNATKDNELIIWIDHIYDLQHNTGTVFNKVSSYAKNGDYAWLTNALDHKARIKEPHEIIGKVSIAMRKLAMRAIKVKTGISYEEFLKNNEPAATPLAPTSYLKPGSKEEKDTFSATLAANIEEQFARIEGDNTLKIARILLSSGWLFESYMGVKMTPSEMLDTLYKVTGWVEHDVDKIFKMLQEEKDLSESLQNSSLLSLSIPEIKAMNANKLVNLVEQYKNFNPYITEEAKQKIRSYLPSNYIKAIKLFREKTNYVLGASKVYVQLEYARMLAEKQQSVAPEPGVTPIVPGKHDEWATHAQDKINSYDGSWSLKWARFILSGYHTQSRNEGITKIIEKLSNQITGTTFNKDQIQEIVMDYENENNLLSYYKTMKSPTLSEIKNMQLNQFQLKQWNKELGIFAVKLNPATYKNAKAKIFANDLIGVIKVLRTATGWELKASKNLAQHLAIVSFIANKSSQPLPASPNPPDDEPIPF